MPDRPAVSMNDHAAAAETRDGAEVRRRWVALMRRIAEPALEAGAEQRLHEAVPLRQELNEEQVRFEPLVTTARVAQGMAGWLSREPEHDEERDAWHHDAQRCRAAIASLFDPDSPDSGDFATSNLTVCYGAQLAQALLVARETLFDPQPEATKAAIRRAFEAQRGHRIPLNNWVLFAAVNEAMLHRCFGVYQPRTVSHALDLHRRWHLGEGVYGDGDHFAADYYNSFVIHPVMLEVLDAVGELHEPWREFKPTEIARAQAAAALLEAMIGPDASYPPLGRSLCYRFGVLRLLGDLARRDALPESLPAGQVRTAMDAVIERVAAEPRMFDEQGWLRHGLIGEQPDLAEWYLTTGSLYFCLNAFGPLALPASHRFWTDPAQPWTSRRIWQGHNMKPAKVPPPSPPQPWHW